MKKIVYTLLIAFCSALLFTSCTEEEVSPRATDAPVGEVVGDKVVK